MKTGNTGDMPLDFTMLLGTSPPAFTFVPYEAVPSPFDDASMVMDGEPPYACRRVATFPMVNRHVRATGLKYRSFSESADLHRIGGAESDPCSLTELKRELHVFVEEEQRELDQRQKEVQISADPSSVGEEQTGAQTNGKKARKKVSFADGRGRELVTVRVMTEPSDVPPKIDPAVIRALLGDQWSDYDDPKQAATWVVNFKQPASEYIAFREKLDSLFVSIENVLVKNDRCGLVGTVRVKNVSFEKEVFLRVTDNEWKSYFDRPCTYSSNRCGDTYDTFKFDFEIPSDDDAHQRIEFCVCYKANTSQEYWDNNEGKNYEIISERLRVERMQMQSQLQSQSTPNGCNGNGETEKGRNGFYTKHAVDALTMDCSNWTEFASWSDLSTQGPYW